MSEYDSTNDTYDHINSVRWLIDEVRGNLEQRGRRHDASKLIEPEKTCYDTYVPLLKAAKFGSPEYDRIRAAMGEGLQHHYQQNDHHPEHWPNGINDMSLPSLLEMLADWKAASARSGKPIDLEVQRVRFGISDQLLGILRNTLKEMGW